MQYLNKKENQPIFYLNYYLDNSKNNSKDDYDTDVLKILNVGREVLSINVKCRTFIEMGLKPNQILYIPVTGYYEKKSVGGLIGEIETYFVPGNIQSLLNLREDIRYNNEYGLLYGFNIEKFVLITYTDIYGEYHELYFRNEDQCSKEFYDTVVQKSNQILKRRTSFNLDDLTLKIIKENIE